MNDPIIIKLDELITYYQNIKFSNASARLIFKSQEMSAWLREIKQEYTSGSPFLNLVKEKEQHNILSGIVLSSLDRLFPINWNKYGVPTDDPDLLIDPNQGNFEINNYLNLDYLKNFFEILKEIYQEQDLAKCLLNIEYTRGIPDPNTVRKHSYIAFSLKNLKANIMILESFAYGNVIYLIFGDKKREWYLGKTKEELNSLPNVFRFEHRDDYSLKIIQQIKDYLANSDELTNSKSDQIKDANPNLNTDPEYLDSPIAKERYLNLVFILDQLGHVDDDGNFKNVIYSVEQSPERKQKYFMVSLLGYSKSVIIMESLQYTHDHKIYIIDGDKILDIKDEDYKRIYLLNLSYESLHNLSYNHGVIRYQSYTAQAVAKISEIIGEESKIIIDNDNENENHFCLLNPNDYESWFTKYDSILTKRDYYLKEALYFMQKNYKIPSVISKDVNESKMGKHLSKLIYGNIHKVSKIFKLNQDLINWREKIHNFNILSDQDIWEKLINYIQINGKRPSIKNKIETFKGEVINLGGKCQNAKRKNYPNATEEQIKLFDWHSKRMIVKKYLQVWNLIWYMKFHKQVPPEFIRDIDEKTVERTQIRTYYDSSNKKVNCIDKFLGSLRTLYQSYFSKNDLNYNWMSPRMHLELKKAKQICDDARLQENILFYTPLIIKLKKGEILNYNERRLISGFIKGTSSGPLDPEQKQEFEQLIKQFKD